MADKIRLLGADPVFRAFMRSIQLKAEIKSRDAIDELMRNTSAVISLGGNAASSECNTLLRESAALRKVVETINDELASGVFINTIT